MLQNCHERIYNCFHYGKRLMLICLFTAGLIISCKKSENGTTNETVSPEAAGGGVLVTDNQAYIGVNYNESFQEIRRGELSSSKTKWVRGFIDVLMHYDNQDLTTNAKINQYLTVKDLGYKTVLNLKFNFMARAYPAVNSTAWNNYISFIDKVLDRVIAKTDVIVVGNEPFIESETSTWDEPLNSFYKAAANRVNQYLTARNIQRPIFVGSFDNMYQSGRQTNAGINNLLAWCKATSWVAGIDLHIHHNNNPEITTVFNFVNDKIRDNQKIIITEYSLMKWWRDNLSNDLTSQFLTACNASTTDNIFPPPAGITKVWQYIDYALKNPRKVEEWNAFNQYTPFLEDRKSYLCNSFKLFKASSKFWLATYAMRQSYPLNTDFTATTDPWILNSLFTPRTVELLASADAQPRYSYLGQFADINTTNTTCP
ncbi:hypothetical protein [Niastella sp. OAS944]|uniref:hypothetical protein n=1 Tax=Niastella sp. OAS944 TaxID=2664089 RepID=UPI003472FE4A|nr:hypothetical protein [Chitinophagaceae bacterium OAS944]